LPLITSRGVHWLSGKLQNDSGGGNLKQGLLLRSSARRSWKHALLQRNNGGGNWRRGLRQRMRFVERLRHELLRIDEGGNWRRVRWLRHGYDRN